MRVIHCVRSAHFGGIEKFVLWLAESQVRAGKDVSIMLDSPEGGLIEEFNKLNVPVIASGVSRGTDVSPLKLGRLRRVFNHYEIVHLHSYSGLKLEAALRSDAGVIYTMHGTSKNTRMRGMSASVREYLKGMQLRRVDRLIANSLHTLELAIAHYGLHTEKAAVVLNGTRIVDSTEEEVDSRDFTVLLAARFIHQKRIERLVDAFAAFRREVGEGRLILLGDGPTRSTIASRVKEAGLEDHVHMPGFVRDVGQFYRVADVCVLPSVGEGFGLVAVEALSRGKPMLVFEDGGGVVEVVRPVEPDDVVRTEAELVHRLLHYFRDPSKVADGAERRRQYCRERFSLEGMEQRYDEIYREALNA